MRKRTKYILGIGSIILVFLISSFTSLINLFTDYMWFKEMGYSQTFLTRLLTKFKIGIPVFLVLFLIIVFYTRLTKNRYYKQVHITPPKDGEKRLNKFINLVSAGGALLISFVFAGNLWFTILQYINATKFNISDPIFMKDISYYLFNLPLLKDLLNLLLLLAFVFIVITVVLYMVLLAIRRPTGESPINLDIGNKPLNDSIKDIYNNKLFKGALVQIGIIGFLIFVIIGINYYIKTYDLVYSTRGEVFGASYTDIHVTLWVYRIMAVGAILSAISFFIGMIKKNIKIALTAPVLLIAISLIGNIGAGVVEKFIVEPDQISKELKYLEHNIDYTQKAYNLDQVTVMDFPVEQQLTKEVLLENEETVKNIRINDYRPINQIYNQIQGIRPYYRFNDIDVGRYTINGEYTEVFLSARELDQERLDEQAKNWINQYLKYTHGYGIALSPVNSVTSEGQPRLLIKDLPPVTDTDLTIERPEIYFGELTSDYIIVNTDEKEFDYPLGSNNKETIYEGKAGIELGGLNKLLFAIRQGNLKILISNNINPDSKIILYRNVLDRVQKIAPFIEYDENPYLVVNQEDGKLYWIVEGYTMSSKYPYSEPLAGSSVNYIRNPVKIVVDAYNGDTKFYVVDEEDPIIMTYKNIFPDLFTSQDAMPEGLKNHIRYPQTLFDIQTQMYRTYHMNNPRVFYAREDYWAIAKEKYMEQVQNVESNYVMFKLPNEDRAEFLLTVPYTPSNKNNMIALFVARNDGENYGKLSVYTFPKSENIPGPMMIESRIDQDSEISPQLTLWSQKGSNVLRGNLLVIPIENSLLYVEPVYLRADNENSLPEMKRVIVAYEGQIVMESSLDKALSKIFGQIEQDTDDSGVIDDVDTDTDQDVSEGDTTDLIQKANELFNEAREASENGDWASYGEYINELEDVLQQLNNTVGNEENIQEEIDNLEEIENEEEAETIEE